MSRTLTAMFDDRTQAETAKQQLQQIGGTVEIRDQSHLSQSSSSSGGFSGSSDRGYNDTDGNTGATGLGQSTYPGGSSSGSGGGFWSELKDMFVSDEDRHSYEEGVRRGGYLLTAHVDESRADEACNILERGGSVDFDQREQSWKSEGWQGYQGNSMSSSTQPRAAMGSQTGSNSNVEEERIPIIEEQLRIGKREVSRGGARVRSYVEETPVDQDVTLREEHVNVERRPVDQPLTGDALTGDAFRERSVEMRETAEEAVVAKEARIREELVVSKSTEQRTEHVHDTVRHTEVDVDDKLTDTDRSTDPSSTDRGAFGFDRDNKR